MRNKEKILAFCRERVAERPDGSVQIWGFIWGERLGARRRGSKGKDRHAWGESQATDGVLLSDTGVSMRDKSSNCLGGEKDTVVWYQVRGGRGGWRGGFWQRGTDGKSTVLTSHQMRNRVFKEKQESQLGVRKAQCLYACFGSSRTSTRNKIVFPPWQILSYWMTYFVQCKAEFALLEKVVFPQSNTKLIHQPPLSENGRAKFPISVKERERQFSEKMKEMEQKP